MTGTRVARVPESQLRALLPTDSMGPAPVGTSASSCPPPAERSTSRNCSSGWPPSCATGARPDDHGSSGRRAAGGEVPQGGDQAYWVRRVAEPASAPPTTVGSVVGGLGLLPFGAAMLWWGVLGPGSTRPQAMDAVVQRTTLVVTGLLAVEGFLAPHLPGI